MSLGPTSGRIWWLTWDKPSSPTFCALSLHFSPRNARFRAKMSYRCLLARCFRRRSACSYSANRCSSSVKAAVCAKRRPLTKVTSCFLCSSSWFRLGVQETLAHFQQNEIAVWCAFRTSAEGTRTSDYLLRLRRDRGHLRPDGRFKASRHLLPEAQKRRAAFGEEQVRGSTAPVIR